jgi:hypothetical protein
MAIRVPLKHQTQKYTGANFCSSRLQGTCKLYIWLMVCEHIREVSQNLGF